ncbi:hypothetical protein FGF1_23350 [Flavobacteriaceae bacterium GF1]
MEQNVPAMAIGTIEGGKLNPFITAGKNAMENPISPNTVFDVASLTKTITTLLTLKLVETNSWDLDMPLSTYWVDPDVVDNPFHKKLTTRHVLAHRSGFKNWRWMNDNKKLDFDFEPGTKFQYSGEGFEYLRRALEKKFDRSFEALADSLVFTANTMTSSYLVWNKNLEPANFAGTHNKEGTPYTYEKSTEANAADNLLTTITDFSTLGVNIINKNYLDDITYNEMIGQQSLVKEGIAFSLGWIVFNDLPNNEYALFNAGSDTGVNALIVLLPVSKRGLIVMTNGDNGRALAMKSIAYILGNTGKEILSRF